MPYPENVILSGKDSVDVTWQFGLTRTEPDPSLCTAAATVAITDLRQERVALTFNGRGRWETPAGHIDLGESLAEAREREVREEVGLQASKSQIFGVRKYTSTGPPAPARTRAAAYPHPISYIPYYYVQANGPLQEPTGTEVVARDEFTLSQVADMASEGLVQQTEYEIIKQGIIAAKADQRLGQPRRIGVIGLGVHGVRSHVVPLTKIAGCTVAAIADLRPDTVAAINQQHLGGRSGKANQSFVKSPSRRRGRN